MTQSANVRSLDAIRDFKAALQGFEEDAANALAALQQEIFRAVDWLEHDRPNYWKRRVQQGYNKVAETRQEYDRCRLRTVAGHRPACIEEKQAVAHAKRQLEMAKEKVEVVKRWCFKIGQEVDEYRGRVGQLQQCLEGDVPRMLALLERMVDSLESYVSIKAVEHDPALGDVPSSDTEATGDGANAD